MPEQSVQRSVATVLPDGVVPGLGAWLRVLDDVDETDDVGVIEQLQ